MTKKKKAKSELYRQFSQSGNNCTNSPSKHLKIKKPNQTKVEQLRTTDGYSSVRHKVVKQRQKKRSHGSKRSDPFEKSSAKSQSTKFSGVIDQPLGSDLQLVDIRIYQISRGWVRFHGQIIPPHFSSLSFFQIPIQ